MNDPLVVRGLETFGDLECDLERLLGGDGTSIDEFSQGLAFSQLHDEQLAPVNVLETIDPGDPRVIEGGEDPCLALESGEPIGVGGKGLRQDLDGDLAAEGGVLGAPHLTHAALTELVQNLVVRQSFADHFRSPAIAQVCRSSVCTISYNPARNLFRMLIDEIYDFRDRISILTKDSMVLSMRNFIEGSWRFPVARGRLVVFGLILLTTVVASDAAEPVEVSSDALRRATPTSGEPPSGRRRGVDVPYPLTADWSNTLRVQVGGLVVADVNGDGADDLIVGCYHSDSFPAYDDWENLIYLNTGSELEATPSWVSDDQRSTGDIQVALINDDPYPDIFAANGGFEMAPSVIYFGSATGPSTTPTWFAADVSWTNYAKPFDFDHDGDVDVATANQGNSSSDPYRPMRLYVNNNGTLETNPSWQSAETSIQNFLAWGDLDGDGWEDLAVSKWANFESGVYRNDMGVLETTPVWTTADTDTDKGVAWADVDGDLDLDLALGHDPTQLWTNTSGSPAVSWTSAATYHGHSDLRWEDIDLDGDPDLAEVHFSDGKAHLYLNRDGALDSVPSWTFDSPHVGTAIAFGDLNGDGLPDLVVGNSGDTSIWVFYNTGVPPIFIDGFESGDTAAWR